MAKKNLNTAATTDETAAILRRAIEAGMKVRKSEMVALASQMLRESR